MISCKRWPPSLVRSDTIRPECVSHRCGTKCSTKCLTALASQWGLRAPLRACLCSCASLLSGVDEPDGCLALESSNNVTESASAQIPNIFVIWRHAWLKFLYASAQSLRRRQQSAHDRCLVSALPELLHNRNMSVQKIICKLCRAASWVLPSKAAPGHHLFFFPLLCRNPNHANQLRLVNRTREAQLSRCSLKWFINPQRCGRMCCCGACCCLFPVQRLPVWMEQLCRQRTLCASSCKVLRAREFGVVCCLQCFAPSSAGISWPNH